MNNNYNNQDYNNQNYNNQNYNNQNYNNQQYTPQYPNNVNNASDENTKIIISIVLIATTGFIGSIVALILTKDIKSQPTLINIIKVISIIQIVIFVLSFIYIFIDIFI